MLPLIVAIVITAADQLTKQWARDAFPLERLHPVIPGFFDLTYIRNTGAAWGMFGGQNTGLTLLSIAMLALMIILRRKIIGRSLDQRIAFGLMIGGIVGNLIDRIRFNFVTDFLYFHAHLFGQDRYFPAFNIADAAICCGVGLYILSSFRKPQGAPAADSQASKPA